MTEKKLIVTSEFKFSGPNNVISSLINGSKCDSLHLTALRKKYSSEYIDSLEINRNNIHFQKSNSSLFHIIYLIKKLKPIVINTHGIRADIFVFILSFFFNFKQISTIHNLPDQDYIMRYGYILGKLMLFFHSIIFRSQKVKKIAVSIYSKKHLISKLSAKNISYIYNGVDSNKYQPSNRFVNNLLPDNKRKKVLFCGHLTDIKDPISFVKSANLNPDIDYILLGSGPLESYIKEYNYENVYIIGRVNNVVDYLNQVDLFVMPSKTEGMPMAFIEAMLMNLPIVCSDIPIFKELSSVQDISVLLFKQNDVDDLSLKIRVALNDKNIKNRAIALNKFSSFVMAEQYLGVFNE
ncbi:glycosyltransferase family 4 protein [Photobacterium leiognathi]|uniref:glycosyltransferase family 4 protein n=1 Tax=Photobacterium leiognathi TaxID=553611 RepID=UPI00298241FC|nr:glycosyltransferase family 4 protein [Photobacterium leiognathi]